MLPAILGISAVELADHVVGLDEIGAATLGVASASQLVDGVLMAPDPVDRLDRLLASLALAADVRLARRAAALLGDGVEVAEVAAAVGYSARQLQRRSSEWFGYGPKHLAAVSRLQRALALGRAGATGAGASVAAGYADPSHLSRDCRRLAGATFAELVDRGEKPAPPGQSASGA